MANTMTTYIKISNLDEMNFDKLKELFETENENTSSVELVNHVNKLYETKFSEPDNFMDREWMEQNIGAKWISIEFDGNEYYPDIDLVTETAWNVPVEYLKKVRDILTQWDKNISLSGIYIDESFSPIGAFVFAHDYDDIEDYDDDVDFDEMMNDDDYYERTYDELYSLRESLYQSYLRSCNEEE
jgi:hypothetical protein